MLRDYEQPIIPPDWRDSWFTFARMVVETLDELHEPIKEKDLVKALQEKINNNTPMPIPDTDWVSMTNYINTSNVAVNVSCFMRRIGNIVFLCGAIKPKSSLSQSSYLDVTTALPEEYRPTKQINLPLAADVAGMWIRIETDGKVKIRNRTGDAIGTGVYVRIDAQYPI